MNNKNKDINHAKQVHLSGKIKDAQKIYLDLIKAEKNNNELFFLLGTTFLQLKNYEEAIKFLKKSIDIDKTFPNPYNNLGIALAETNMFYDAIENYNKAIKLNKNYIDAYLNRGISFNKIKKYQLAIEDFKIVEKNNPLNAKVYNNMGNVYKNIKDFSKSMICYEKAISLEPNYLEAISNKSSIHYEKEEYSEALNCLKKIFKINPKFKGLIADIVTDKMCIFDWENLDKFLAEIREQLSNNKYFIDPLVIQYLFDEPNLHKINAERAARKNFEHIKKKNIKKIKFNNKKIKIGYFSAEFHDHPVLHIMRNIYKSHDNTKFEIYAFSFGPEKKNNYWREDIKSNFKELYLINDMNDEDIIKLTSDLKIDIAIDLTGLTKNSRQSLFYKRIAPIQIMYLGYPGTSGNTSMDYIIADKNVITKKDEKFYTEKILYLPKCYISSSNDVLLKKITNVFNRKDYNLPEKEIVFCAFHNPLKINPELFSSWMKILMNVERSVLWMKVKNEISKTNLLREVKKYKIDANRIIFTSGEPDKNKHIGRLKLADIFLDTFPYNSHSTVYDYIRAELPMIILKGKSFPSRVGASIYSSIGMDDLIASNYSEYEKKAINLGNKKFELKKIKEKLRINSEKNNLFNNKTISKDLENIYKQLLNNSVN